MIDWIATSLSILGLVFNAKKSAWCWPIWLLGSVLWLTYACTTKQASLALLQIVFVAANIYGWSCWCKDIK
jgi:nicotinamide mononucleotide transporter